jgi:hypothetical protein
MDRKVLGAKQKNILMQMKGFIPVMTDNKEVFVYDTPVFRDFCELVEADCDTLCRLKELYSGEITYSKEDGHYIVTCLMKKEGCIAEGLSVELESEEDFLGLYSEIIEDNSLGDFFNDNLENVVRKMREIYPDVVESIEQNVISHIRGYDLEDSDKEYFAESYIEDNPVSSVEIAESYLSDDDKKRFICDWVDNL